MNKERLLNDYNEAYKAISRELTTGDEDDVLHALDALGITQEDIDEHDDLYNAIYYASVDTRVGRYFYSTEIFKD